MGWRDKCFDIDAWIAAYIRRRYNVYSFDLRRAWRLLARTVYGKESCDGTSKNNVINENASLAIKQLPKLMNAQVHSSIMLPHIDAKMLRKLGVNLTSSPVYEDKVPKQVTN